MAGSHRYAINGNGVYTARERAPWLAGNGSRSTYQHSAGGAPRPEGPRSTDLAGSKARAAAGRFEHAAPGGKARVRVRASRRPPPADRQGRFGAGRQRRGVRYSGLGHGRKGAGACVKGDQGPAAARCSPPFSPAVSVLSGPERPRASRRPPPHCPVSTESFRFQALAITSTISLRPAGRHVATRLGHGPRAPGPGPNSSHRDQIRTL